MVANNLVNTFKQLPQGAQDFLLNWGSGIINNNPMGVARMMLRGDSPQQIYNTLFYPNQNKQQPVAQNIQQPTQQVTPKPQDSTPARRNYGFKPDTIQGMIVNEAYAQGVDPALALAIAQQESGFNPNVMGDGGNSYGLFQIYSPAHPNYSGGLNPQDNIKYGVGFLKQLNNQFGGDLNKTIMAYNAGAGAVSSGNIPASTRQRYLPNVLANFNRFNQGTNKTPPVQNMNVQNNQIFNQSPVEGSPLRVTTSGNENIYLNNLMGLNEPPSSSNEFNQFIQMLQGVEMPQRDNQNLLQDINTIANLVGGAQQGFQQPQVGVTPEQVQAYMNAVNVAGQNMAGVNQEMDALRNAYNLDRRNRTIAGLVDAGARIADGFRPRVRASYTSPISGLTVQSGDFDPIGDIGTEALRNAGSRLQDVQTMNAINQMGRQAQQDLADRVTNAVNALQVSEQTGLPVNVVANMESKDYVDYVNRLNQERGLNTREGLQAVRELLTGRQEGENTLTNTQLDRTLQNQGDMATTLATQLGNLQREQLAQMNENQRTAADLVLRKEIAQMDNNTKLAVQQLTGMNQQDLERLRQQDPIGYMNALSNFVTAGSFLNTPFAQQLYNAAAQTNMNNPQIVNPMYRAGDSSATLTGGGSTPNQNMINAFIRRYMIGN